LGLVIHEENYKEIYSNKRDKKLKKFASFLEKIGLEKIYRGKHPYHVALDGRM